MTYLGAHLSSAGGFYKMGRAALAIGANTLQCFVRNPRGARAKAVDPEDLGRLRALLAEEGFGPIVAHAPYIMNPCSKDPGIRALAAEMMAGDLALMEHLPGNYYNFHPGSHTGQGVEAGCRQIADMLSRVVTPDLGTVVLLETMAGKGSEIGGSFRELRAIHVNDSMNPPGARKDRHARIGAGTIGTEALLRLIAHPALAGRPFLLETPTDDAGHGEEIALLRALL